MPGDIGEWEPPDPIPNSEVKLLSADDSVGFPYAKVGHRQALNIKPLIHQYQGLFLMGKPVTGFRQVNAFPGVTLLFV